MPSQVGITLGIVQALYHKPVALAKLDTTAFSDAVTLGNDLLVELSVSREGDVFLLHSRIYDDFFGFVDPYPYAEQQRGQTALLCHLLRGGV
jgi:hypothetical protein